MGAPGLDLMVVALSARALARSARRAGLRALAIDLFADADTRQHASLSVRAEAGRSGMGFSQKRLVKILSDHAPKGLPIVLGTGFEHAPGLMRAIARRNPILGASPETVARLKDPVRFSELLEELGIPHPPIAPTADARLPSPARPERISTQEPRWLSKRAAASGGGHIRESARAGRDRYLQRHVDGRAVSVLFLANGRKVSIVGFSEQWPDPTPRAPYRYGGAAGPIAVAPDFAAAIEEALTRLVSAAGLVGLASADLIVRPGRYSLLEINPRPGGSLDVFDHAPMPSLLALHLDACAGALPDRLPILKTAHAAAIVYADRPIAPAALPRPVWTADWPSCDETVPSGAPFCTILAAAPSPFAARALLDRRRAELISSLRAASAPARTNLKKAYA